MADFNQAYTKTMQAEGGYANHPSDRGGMTYKGIARKFNPGWPGWFTVDQALKQTGIASQINKLLAADLDLQARVNRFYKVAYWDVNRLDEFTSQSIANELFDTGVNMGTGTAAKFLQRALNASNKVQRLYPNMVVDGIVGKNTLATVNAHPNPIILLKMLNVLQGARYFDLMEKSESQEVFAASWFDRV